VRIAFVASIALASTAAVWAQTELKTPNIAIHGCLLSQGYATFVLDNARVDATGERAVTAAPKSASVTARPANEPPKWVLDEPGNVRTHVGEEVQVVGVTDWKPDDPAPTGPAAPTPRVTVIAVKYLSPNCS